MIFQRITSEGRDLEQRLAELPKTGEIVTMCSVGHRGGMAASILARNGRRAVNYLGGYNAWKQAEPGRTGKAA